MIYLFIYGGIQQRKGDLVATVSVAPWKLLVLSVCLADDCSTNETPDETQREKVGNFSNVKRFHKQLTCLRQVSCTVIGVSRRALRCLGVCFFVLVTGWVVLLILFRCLRSFGQLCFHLRLGCCSISIGEFGWNSCLWLFPVFLLKYFIYLGLCRLQSAHIIKATTIKKVTEKSLQPYQPG